MEKAAKLLEAKFPDEALALYTKAADTVGNEDRPKEASEYLAKVAKLQVRTGSFKQGSPVVFHKIFFRGKKLKTLSSTNNILNVTQSF